MWISEYILNSLKYTCHKKEREGETKLEKGSYRKNRGNHVYLKELL